MGYKWQNLKIIVSYNTRDYVFEDCIKKTATKLGDHVCVAV